MTIKSGWTGRYFEDFEVGDVYQHPLGRTVSEADNTWFTLLTMNTNQMHFNTEYAAKSEFSRPLVVSTLTVAIAVVFSESLVKEKRESGSRPGAGIVTVRTRTLNQDGAEVCSFLRTFYVYKKGAPQVEGIFPEGKQPLSLESEEGRA